MGNASEIKWYIRCEYCRAQLCIHVRPGDKAKEQVQCPCCKKMTYTVKVAENVVALQGKEAPLGKIERSRKGCIVPLLVKPVLRKIKHCTLWNLLDWALVGLLGKLDYCKAEWYVLFRVFVVLGLLIAFDHKCAPFYDCSKRSLACLFLGIGAVLLLETIVTLARHHLFEIPADPKGFYPPRSLMLALVNLVEAILIYGLFYSVIAVLSPGSFPGEQGKALANVWDAIFFSLATIFTVDPGIKYYKWAKVCVATQLFIGLLIFAVVLATLAGHLTSGLLKKPNTGDTNGSDHEDSEKRLG